MIIAFAAFFPQSDEAQHADENISANFTGGPTEGVWQRISGIDKMKDADSLGSILVALGSIIGSAIAGYITKQYALFLGVGIYISTVALIWTGTAPVIESLIKPYDFISEMLVIITIALTALFIFSIIEMFNAQKGVN